MGWKTSIGGNAGAIHARRATLAAVVAVITTSLLTACGGSNSRSYSVSASVSGLSGSDLTLQLNSGQMVSVSAVGSVTFPNRLRNGASYQVTVSAQPSTPAQTCLVSNGSGTIAASDISNVSIACAFGVWTWIAGNQQPDEDNGTNVPATRTAAEGWSDHLGHLWLFGGRDFDIRGALSDLWRFDLATGEWTYVGDAVNGPEGRMFGASLVDSSNRLWLFGGAGILAVVGTEDYRNDLWMYDPSAGIWTLVAGPTTANGAGTYGTQGVAAASNVPGARSNAAAWIDGSNNLWLFGGEGIDGSGNTGFLGDLWRFNQSSGEWTWVAGSQTANSAGSYGVQGVASATNAPPARSGAATWVDSAGTLWLYGGGDNTQTGGAVFGDLWKFDPAVKQWTWVGGSSLPDPPAVYGSLGVAAAANTPGAVGAGPFWTDPSGRFWLLSSGPDVWMLSASNGEWTWMYAPPTTSQACSYGTLNVPAVTNFPCSLGAASWGDSSGNLYVLGTQDTALWRFTPAQ